MGNTTSKNDISFEIQVSGITKNKFRVLDFEVHEQLSKCFFTKLTIACQEDTQINIQALLDREATLTIHHKYPQLKDDGIYTHSGIDVPPRIFHGILSHINYIHSTYEWTLLEFIIEPHLSRLKLTSDCRIFQYQSVPQIIKTILDEHGIQDYQFKLRDTHIEREYLVQYNETHFDFFQRLLAEEGIFYYFRHEQQKNNHTLIMTDLTQGGTSLQPDPHVEYNDNAGGSLKAQYIKNIAWQENLRPNQRVQRDYCFKAPYYNQEQTSTIKTTPQGETLHRHYQQYDAHARYKHPHQGIPFTQYQLNAQRADATQAMGLSNLIHFSAGRLFNLNQHPIKTYNKSQLLVSVTHVGTQPQVLEESAFFALMRYEQGSPEDDIYHATTYNNEFTIVEDTIVSWRAPMQPKPVIHGTQMAHVVGPKGEEIYTDQYGRVKLHFTWDRYSQQNETSSCWIRVSQAWAGRTWGFMAIPRIGHEVIVDYIEGDPDQPIVVGRTYHAANPHPYSLPANKTQTGIKTRSSKGGDSRHYNEIRFEDLKDQEQIYIHAEKNQDNVVEVDETTDVGRNRSENIGNHETIQIGHDRKEDVGHDETITIGHDRSEQVGHNETIKIGNDQQNQIGNDQTRHITKNRTTHIGKDDIVKIDNHKKLDVIENQSTKTGGHLTHEVGGKSHLKAGDKIINKTSVFELDATKKATFASSGATIIIDSSGITFKGMTTIKGNMSIAGGSPEAVKAVKLRFQLGEDICIPCLLKEQNKL